ncbi:transglycosylase SLT domain-containing protein [Streptomyces meridianus]|uniref:Transglycosylase SLT domain-containing protein n=1 Tax=Streptomyces meridianus TaxID=2938945 RepID=A0ABT0X4Y7_9ACTN|nr:transglycosylase SLT domain-containing protein [Streptomyces meridianus]MCM2577484.1 transglycosylase SLT domain-containing protein [Streptomyces meridianus]
MRIPNFSGYNRLSKTHRYSVAGIAAAGAAAMAFAVVPGHGDGDSGQALSAKPVAADAHAFGSKATKDGVKAQAGAVSKQAAKNGQTDEAKKKAAQAMANAKIKYAAEQKQKAEEAAKAKAAAAAKAKAEKERAAKAAADRSARAKAAKAAEPTYPNNLDGWIREALAIMKKEGIPGSYEGIHRNIMRESGGDPNAINNWDINAQNGVPSIGLLQVIKPTFDAYHVKGTAYDQRDPVANIVAACNYAADRYGSMDNVNSAY